MMRALEKWAIASSNTLLLLLIGAALVFDVLDLGFADLSSETKYRMDDHPAYSTMTSMARAGYVPCDTWLTSLAIAKPAPPGGTHELEITNDFAAYTEYDSVTAITKLVKEDASEKLRQSDAEKKAICIAFQDGFCVRYAMANLGHEFITKQMRGWEQVRWVSPDRQPVADIQALITSDPETFIMIYAMIWNDKESRVSSVSQPPKSQPSKAIFLRLYKGKITMGEIRKNARNPSEPSFHHGRHLLAEAVMWGDILSSCDGEYLSSLLQLDSTFDPEMVSKSCGQVLKEGGVYLRQQLKGPLQRPIDPKPEDAASSLVPYHEFASSALLLNYVIPSGDRRDLAFSTKEPWVGTYGSRGIAVTRAVSSPNDEPLIETGDSAGVHGGALNLNSTSSVTSLSERETGTYISNSTFVCDLQLALYVFLLVLGNGLAFLPQYMTKISMVYMVTRTSVLHVVLAQYALWNYWNLGAVIHLVRVSFEDTWTDLRTLKNVIMTSYLIMIYLYHSVYELQVRTSSICIATATMTLYWVFEVIRLDGRVSEIVNGLKDVRLIDGIGGVSDPVCFYADKCYITNVTMAFVVRVYGPVVGICLTIFLADRLVQVFREYRDKKISASTKYIENSKDDMLTCFEGCCTLSRLRDYFRQDAEYYNENDKGWCVKEEWIIMCGFCISPDRRFIVRNRDLLSLWVSNWIPAIILKKGPVHLSMSYWPIIDGHVGLGRHFMIDGPLSMKLGTMKVRCCSERDNAFTSVCPSPDVKKQLHLALENVKCAAKQDAQQTTK